MMTRFFDQVGFIKPAVGVLITSVRGVELTHVENVAPGDTADAGELSLQIADQLVHSGVIL